MTPKCRILCPTFGGHIISPTLRLLLCNKREPSTGSTLCVFTIPHFRGFVNRFPPVPRTILQKAAGGDCHRQSFQKPKWSSIPRQCAHWHGICWMRGCFRRKRRNPAFLNEMRAGRILKEDGLVCGSKPFSASLSRILSPFLGGTRKGPPEGHPAQIFDRAFDKRRPAGVWRQSTGLPGLYRRGLP